MKHLLSPVALLAALCGCSTPPPPPPAPAPANMGGDRDAHGCLTSAGYRWCAATDRCERPWELARAQGFANTAEGFNAYCDKAAGQP